LPPIPWWREAAPRVLPGPDDRRPREARLPGSRTRRGRRESRPDLDHRRQAPGCPAGPRGTAVPVARRPPIHAPARTPPLFRYRGSATAEAPPSRARRAGAAAAAAGREHDAVRGRAAAASRARSQGPSRGGRRAGAARTVERRRPPSAPSPGTSGTRQTPMTGSTPPGGQAPGARGAAPRSTGGGGRARWPERPDRPRRRRTDTPGRHRPGDRDPSSVVMIAARSVCLGGTRRVAYDPAGTHDAAVRRSSRRRS